jgi:hypothetical protein
LAFDLEIILRGLKPEKSKGQIRRRSDDRLRFVDPETKDTPIMLDTSVYIDRLSDRLPGEVGRLIGQSVLEHSTVALCELAHPFGRLDPEHPETATTLDAIRATIAAISENRLSSPSPKAVVQAGIVTGMIGRRKGLTRQDRQPMLNDATLLFHALERGCVLLTGNVSDFDMIEQLVVAARTRVLYYRTI